MYGKPNGFRPSGAGRGRNRPEVQPMAPPPPPQDHNLLYQNPNMFFQNPNLFLQNSAFPFAQNPNFLFQDPNFLLQNPNFMFQNPNLLPANLNFPTQSNYFPPQQQIESSSQNPIKSFDRNNRPEESNKKPSVPSQNVNFPRTNNIEAQLHGGSQESTKAHINGTASNPKFFTPDKTLPQDKIKKSTSQTPNISLEKIERAVTKARRKIIAAGESVSAWNVSVAVIEKLKVDSWSSLAFQMQEVPSLWELMMIEGKINSFINCFIGTRRLTSIYDLEVAICKIEGIKQFDELKLGPLVRHPLVLHYFSMDSDVNAVYNISSKDIISYLWEYTDIDKKRKTKASEFLDFIAEKRSLRSRDELGVRIQNLEMHVTFIREAKKIEDASLIKGIEEKLGHTPNINRGKKRPLFSKQKKQFDERFSAMSKRIKSFSTFDEVFKGEHIKFDSSDSEENNCQDNKKVEVKNNDDDDGNYDVNNRGETSSKSVQSCDRVSKCPYPSATEERTRLGIKGEMEIDPSPSYSFRYNESNSGPSRKKRKFESDYSNSAPTKLTISLDNINENHEPQIWDDDDFALANSHMGIFVSTWKNACLEETVSQVLDRMLQCYRLSKKQKRRFKSILMEYPCFGLVNAAITSIKLGKCDSIYDTLQDGLNDLVSDPCPKYESIEVEPSVKNELIYESRQGVTVEEIISKIISYFDLNHDNVSNGKLHLDDQFLLLKKLCNCELWLTDQFSVKEFKSLGHGEFFSFLQTNASLLSVVPLNSFFGDKHEKSPIRVCMVENQLLMCLSQALNGSWEDGLITKEKISAFLTRQFPLISFSILENGSAEEFFNMVRDRLTCVTSNCVLYSSTLSGTYDYENLSNQNLTHVPETRGQRPDRVTSIDAIQTLLKAPMLIDLNMWAHWDLIFAPSLGPLVAWLSNDVNEKELLCLVTKDGKVIRINHLATLDSFLEASLQASSPKTAVELLSLFSLSGGKKHVHMSLLKSHTRQAFQVILQNGEENENEAFRFGTNKVNKAASIASRFILDCLGFMPSEFRCFGADVLLFGLRSFRKDAPLSILAECKQIEERFMLHDIGLSLGIFEWINDYHTLVKDPSSMFSSSSNSLDTERTFDKLVFSKGKAKEVPAESNCVTVVNPEISRDEIDKGCVQNIPELSEYKDANLIIESIRREEFGLDTSVSETESSLLKKQHARLGRALHCLSQELYSQDSHFLLELVQNADDNIYLENVEPTLTFILRDTGIVVLNNEQGFLAHNIRALCDVGNSTKKGSGAGYIGQKGIGFKSVFRVTDAPEIHSNGFHVKFDISEGQIGFVLPTLVPPVNTNLFGGLASEDDTDQLAAISSFNTCIVLPFRSKSIQENALQNIISMFSDLHPSLLLFLHRLRCIKFKNLLDNSLVVMRKEQIGNGIIKVSRGCEKITWLSVSQKLQSDSILRSGVKTTEIALAFTLDESENSDYVARLEPQPVFAFLPLRAYGLKFILQGDFVLPSSREEVDGDSPWNQWLLSEFPSLFLSAEKSFCNLPCFKENIGKAISTFMSFVPLIGEVHGFFSSLPRMIISKLRMSNCVLLEGDTKTWVPPCKAIRKWNEQARILLPENLLRDHLGLGFLDKNIVLSEPLARALGMEEYGSKILLQIISSLSHTDNALKSIGMSWLSAWLNELYTMAFHSTRQDLVNTEAEFDIIENLRKIPFIPLSNGKYVSLDEGTIWLPSDTLTNGVEGDHGLETFPILYSNLHTVNPSLLSSCKDTILIDNITRILHRIGVQQLSAHEIIKIHVLPYISDDKIMNRDTSLMIEYIAFVMLHLQSGCLDCHVEREYILSELRTKAYILTNYGYKRLAEVPIHFDVQYGNLIKINKLIDDDIDFKWHEIDVSYLSHSLTNSTSSGLTKWRIFFQELGVTDFINVSKIEKSMTNISQTLLNNIISDGELISLESIAKDWESEELVKLISLLALNGNKSKCKYLLEFLDTLWDQSYSDKAMGYCTFKSKGDNNKPFKTSFMSNICDAKWVVSCMDDKLHYPKDLFHDCDAVRSVLGDFAPYAVPKVKSEKLLGEIGFKIQVTLDDILKILKLWRKTQTPVKASIAQMSRFYTFIWNEMSTSKKKIMKRLRSVPFIFVPCISGSRHDDVVPGVFLSPDDVYWHDSTGSIELMKLTSARSDSNGGALSKTLSHVYSGLREFFVDECGVHETPPLRRYLQILLQLSSIALPSQAAHAVFQVFLKWANGLKSGLLDSEDLIYLKESLINVEFTLLPTLQDKWVSLHASFGLVCFCDNDDLKKEFKHCDNIDFINFGELSNDDKESLRGNVSVLLQALGIPSISEVVSREAIYHGINDDTFKASLVNWVLPYGQRYIYHKHPAKYSQLKQSGFEKLLHFRVIVVERLLYRNVIKQYNISAKKRFDCNCLLQDNILFTTSETDTHSIFVELSRLFFDGTPELNFANFLHMLTTMVESGSNEEQLEFFILNSQKLPKPRNEDHVWSLSSSPSSIEKESILQKNALKINSDQNVSKSKKKDSNWPPADWKTAPDFNFARLNGFKTQPASVSQQPNNTKSQENLEGTEKTLDVNANWTIEEDNVHPAISKTSLNFTNSETFNESDNYPYNLPNPTVDLPSSSDGPDSSKFSMRDQVNLGNPNPAVAQITGRLGEHLASIFFSEKYGKSRVNWVNEKYETGFPFDIKIGEGDAMEFIEVKATRAARKDWFIISPNEWKFAMEKGDAFSIAHVVLSVDNTAKVAIFKNPLQLCKMGQLQLLLMMPKQQKEYFPVSESFSYQQLSYQPMEL